MVNVIVIQVTVQKITLVKILQSLRLVSNAIVHMSQT